MLVGRNREYTYFNGYMEQNGSQMIVFYGQKFIGKTSFLLDFCKDIPHSYFLSKPIVKEWMLDSLEQEIRKLQQLDTDQKKILIIDEFQEFSKNEDFMPVLINLMQSGNFLIILVSSEVNWVETAMVRAFGRTVASISGFYKVKPLSFQNICQIYPQYSRADLFIMYSIYGGIPGLWNYFDVELSVEDNIITYILSQRSFLRQAGYSYSMSGLRESSVYDTILLSMANGNTKLNDLYRITGFSRAKISVYLRTLMEQEQINKIYSIDCAGHDNSQKGIYDISNHFTAFWFKFVYIHEDELLQMDEKAFYDKYIRDELLKYCSKYLKEILKEYFCIQGILDPADVSASDCFLGKQNQIPFVWKSHSVYHVVLCDRIKTGMTYDDYERLVQAAAEARMREKEYYIVSFRDFDEKLSLESRMKKNIHLLSFADILEHF